MAYTPSCMHASMHMALLQALSILLLASMLMPAGSAEEAPSGYHVDANGGFTREELIRPAVDRTHLRAAMQSVTLTRTEVDPGHYEYFMELKIGTPPEPFRAVADTGSDYVWTKQLMKLCSCSSSTFTLVPACSKSCPDGPCNYWGCKGLCLFKKMYANDERAIGFMGNEKLTLSADNEKKYPIEFGCAIDIGKRLQQASADGIVGLNRGPMSLVKQLKFTKFSYCLSNLPGKSTLWFGGDDPAPSDGWNRTPLLPIKEATPVWAHKYAVGLDAISIGMYRINIDEKMKKKFTYSSTDGKAVMFLDTGSTHTILPQIVLKELKTRLAKELDSKWIELKTNGYKETLTCLKAPSKRPDMVLHFTGTKAETKSSSDMHLPWDNYMLKVESEGKSEFSCLAIHAGGISILGNFQQQNIHMLYDLTEGLGKLSFIMRKECGN